MSPPSRYAVEQVECLHFIKRAQALGFTLSEIGGLLRLDKGCACVETGALAVTKLALIEHKIADLAVLQKKLIGLTHNLNANLVHKWIRVGVVLLVVNLSPVILAMISWALGVPAPTRRALQLMGLIIFFGLLEVLDVLKIVIASESKGEAW